MNSTNISPPKRIFPCVDIECYIYVSYSKMMINIIFLEDIIFSGDCNDVGYHYVLNNYLGRSPPTSSSFFFFEKVGERD
jgi:hypothetical protein